MNTLVFKYVAEIEKTRSITKAAENLYMAQPNLSKAVKELEDTLGFAIFERTSRGVVPTKQGSEFLVHAKNILGQLKKVEHMSQAGKNDFQRFSLAIPRGSYITRAFTNFVKSLDPERGMDINMRETSSVNVINDVTEGECRLGIIRYSLDYENYFKDYLKEKRLGCEPIWEFKHLVLMSRKNPLADADEICSSDLEKMIEIVHGDTVVPYLSAGYMDEQRMRKISIYERGSQFDLLVNVPNTYMLVSAIPQPIIDSLGLVQRKYSGNTKHYKDVLIYREGYVLSDIDKQFVAYLTEAKNSVAFCNYE